MRKLIAVAAALAVVGFVTVTLKADDDKPKFTIKEVMQKAMKGGLCKKCASGKASDDEKKELVELFEALAKNEPPKGDKESWKKKTEALVAGAKAVSEGTKGGTKKLGGAANCKACHDNHK